MATISDTVYDPNLTQAPEPPTSHILPSAHTLPILVQHFVDNIWPTKFFYVGKAAILFLYHLLFYL